MKKIILLMTLVTGFYSSVAAQDTCSFYLTPDVQVQKEIVLKSASGLFDLNVMVGIKWLQVDNKIHLLFDRKEVKGNDSYILVFPMLKQTRLIKEVADCKSGRKTLWSKLKSEDSKSMQYFLRSENLTIDNYMDCYKLLPNNNEDEFVYEIKELEDFVISLPGFFVVKSEKRPWYAFSKRDKKVLFKTIPFDLNIQFEHKQVFDTCAIAEKVINYIEAYKKILDEDSQELLAAQKNKSCVFFNLLKSKMRTTFVDLNSRCERYTTCGEVGATIKEYNQAFEKIFSETCVAAATPARAATCTLNENELTMINNRLKNLQMKINVKKKNNESTSDESKEYKEIKTSILPRLTPECRKSYKAYIDALENYCSIIDGLL